MYIGIQDFWCYKLGTPIFGKFLPFFFAKPPKHTAVFRPLPTQSDQVKVVIFMDFTVPLEEGCDEAQERKTLK